MKAMANNRTREMAGGMMATPWQCTMLSCCNEFSKVASLQNSTTRPGVNSMQNKNFIATCILYRKGYEEHDVRNSIVSNCIDRVRCHTDNIETNDNCFYLHVLVHTTVYSG